MDWDENDNSSKARGRLDKKFIKCLDCRAFIGETVFAKITYCPFCDGANWRENGNR